MRWLLVFTTLFAFLGAPLQAAGVPSVGLRAFAMFVGPKQQPTNWVLHKQSVAMDKSDWAPAERSCENWSWVAGISDMAAARGAHIPQQYLIDRLYGGSRCLSSTGDMATLADEISHVYYLLDGQKFGIQAQFTPGAPTNPGMLIVAVREKRPLMLLWKTHAYLLVGVDYDEFIAPTGNKMYIVTKMKLFDPAGRQDQRYVTFDRDRDDTNDLNGWLDLEVTPR